MLRSLTCALPPLRVGVRSISYRLYLTALIGIQVLALQSQGENTRALGVSLDSALAILQQQTTLHIAYASYVLPKKKYLIPDARKSWKNTLRTLLDQADLTFRIIDKNIIILPKKKHLYHGYIYDKTTGESLPGAHLSFPSKSKGSVSNNEGYFQIFLPEGQSQVQISYLGYQQLLLEIDAHKTSQLDVYLIPALDLPQVTVSDSLRPDSRNIQSTIEQEIPLRNLTSLPSLSTSMDVSRYLQFVAGVSSGSDGFGGMHVRGGGSDQNLILLDDIPIYNPFHMLGTNSIFNGDAIQQIKLSKSFFPGQYGGRLSSVLNVRMRDGHRDKTTLNAGMSVLSAHAVVEMPILRKKGTLMLAGQRSHAGNVIRNYSSRGKASQDSDGYFQPKFRDFYGKAMFNLSTTDKIILNFYTGTDAFTDVDTYLFYDIDTTYRSSFRDEYNWGNAAGAVRWQHTFKPNVFGKTSLYYSRYRYQSINGAQFSLENSNNFQEAETELAEFRSRVEEKGVKTELDILAGYQHLIHAGLGFSKFNYTPGIIAYNGEGTISEEIFDDQPLPSLPDELFDDLKFKSWQLHGYFQDEWTLNSQWSIRCGIHANLFGNGNIKYFLLQPRMNLRWISGRVTVDLSYTNMRQPQHLISANDSGLPNELWVPSTANIAPQSANMVDLSTSTNIGKNTLWRSSLYYKKMNNLISFIDTPSYLSFGRLDNIDASAWEMDVTRGEGESWGIENSVQQTGRNYFFGLNYTYAKSTRFFEGKYLEFTYPYRFERPHEFSLLGNWKISASWSLGVSWQLGSGVALPLNSGLYDLFDHTDFFQETIEVRPGDIELLVMPGYHRLDISLTYQLKRKRSTHLFKLSVLNAYDRTNISYPSVFLGEGVSQIRFSAGLPFIPSLSYHVSLQ